MVVVVLATIRSLEQRYGWYYVACRKHNKKVVRRSEFVDLEDIDAHQGDDDGALYCNKCKGKAPSVYPRLVINILCFHVIMFQVNYVLMFYLVCSHLF